MLAAPAQPSTLHCWCVSARCRVLSQLECCSFPEPKWDSGKEHFISRAQPYMPAASRTNPSAQPQGAPRKLLLKTWAKCLKRKGILDGMGMKAKGNIVRKETPCTYADTHAPSVTHPLTLPWCLKRSAQRGRERESGSRKKKEEPRQTAHHHQIPDWYAFLS